MAITFQDVEKAVKAAQEAGSKPTIQGIRAQIGGSEHTIIKHLRQIEQKTQAVKAASALPALPVELAKALSEALAGVESSVRAETAEQIASLQAQVDNMLEQAERMEAEAIASAEALKEAQEVNGRLTGVLQEREVENERLRAAAVEAQRSQANAEKEAAVASALLNEIRTQAKTAQRPPQTASKGTRKEKAGGSASEAPKAP